MARVNKNDDKKIVKKSTKKVVKQPKGKKPKPNDTPNDGSTITIKKGHIGAFYEENPYGW